VDDLLGVHIPREQSLQLQPEYLLAWDGIHHAELKHRIKHPVNEVFLGGQKCIMQNLKLHYFQYSIDIENNGFQTSKR
jgi:hypothetical protein